MIREPATVVAWENGIATLRCQQKVSCSGCKAKATCGIRMVNQAAAGQALEFQIPIEQPLSEGQQVEIGINESNLLYSALLIYIVPLLGIFIGAGLAYWLTASDGVALFAALFGGALGFFVAKKRALKLEQLRYYQPIVLQIVPFGRGDRPRSSAD